VPAVTDTRTWLAPALCVVLAVTGLRLALLAFNKTDLFVDEAQYWLWGQEFAFGYYSKPPLIAWVVGGVTALMGDGPFWVRAPAAVFHGAAGLILAALAARLQGPRVAIWVAAAYVTLPMAAVGSLIMSTDTIMAPFFCAALYFHHRVVAGEGTRFAVFAGIAAGFACLAKYAAVYFLLGFGLAALFVPAMRFPWRQAVAMLVAFGAVISPNILWNLGHDLTTVSHTMDNVGWVRQDNPLAALRPQRGLEFIASQFGVMGPALFAALLWGLRRRSGLAAFVLPALIVVTVQAVMDKAYANWAASAFFAGTIIAVVALSSRPRLRAAAVAINATICVILPLLTLMPEARFGRASPVLDRYLGRADLSRQLIAAARAQGNLPIVADSRDVLADLFYTGAGVGIAFHAPPQTGRPMNHYAQTYALPRDATGPVLYVTRKAFSCDQPMIAQIALDTANGAYAKDGLQAYVMEASCLAQF
jgi:4-amino-4-deoxy-L-arabinose transferase-like glycosyltransferase